MLPEPRLARQIVETLGQSGTPLSKGVSFYNAGNESLLNAIDTHYLGSYLADGGAVFKLVVGDYGSGKSHFLYCVRDRAWQRNFAVSKVDLSPKESPYDDQRRVYAAVASALIWHELGGLGEDEQGLARFLEGTLRRLVSPNGLDLGDEGAEELPDVRALLQTVTMTPIDSLSYHKAIVGYLTALLRGQTRRLEALERWLHGDEVSPEDMRDLRTIGVTEKINKNNAFKMLRSLCQAVRALGYTGLALLFDEGDRMLSIGGKAAKTCPVRSSCTPCRPISSTRLCPNTRPCSSASRLPTTSRAAILSARRSIWNISTFRMKSCLSRSGTGCCRSSIWPMAASWIRRCKVPIFGRFRLPPATPTWPSAIVASSSRRW
jgi:hypothetical protein